MKLFKMWRFAALLFCVATLQANPVERVEPGHWWAGMAAERLQVMLYGPAIAEYTVEMDHPGVRLDEVVRVASPNYLFLYLHLNDDLVSGEAEIRLTRDNAAPVVVPFMFRAREVDSAMREGFSTADVMYLLMPDRFANGDPSNDIVEGMRGTTVDRSEPYGRHGGDLAGIMDHLDYIKEMGFTALWLNPFLENDQDDASYHGYATTDYYRVDPRFGEMETAVQLAEEARARGIKLIKDVIPNHCGHRHWWMRDPPTADWFNHPGAEVMTNHYRTTHQDPYADPDDAASMTTGWFVSTMPDLNVRNRLLGDYLIQNAIWWIEMLHLAGLRIDTYPYPDRDYMLRWAAAIRHEYPRLNLVGEEWSTRPAVVAFWQDGNRHPSGYVGNLPSLFDFPTQVALTEALTAPDQWDRGFIQLYETVGLDYLYPDADNLVIFTGNHDMHRYLVTLENDVDLARNAMVWLATFRGIPQFFYGDEILMSHAPDAGHGALRKDFPGGWAGDARNGFTGEGLTEAEAEFQHFVRDLFTWRGQQTAIHDGLFRHYTPEDKTYVYFRLDEASGERVMVVLNRNPEPVTLDTKRFHRWVKPGTKGRHVLEQRAYTLPETLELAPKEPFLFSFR